MNVFTIQKSNGKTRTIYAPGPVEKRRLRALVPQLNLLAEELDIYKVQHGFTEHRSPLTNAREHIGFLFTVSFDLQDFFDTVSVSHVSLACRSELNSFNSIMPVSMSYEDFFPGGAARQGLPTSPALANIAASPMDKEIWERFCIRKGRFPEPPAKMTRYADDITISTNSFATVQLLLQEIPKIVAKHGFVLNEAKTKVQCGKAGRRIITGVAVDDKTVYIPRSVRRRIRAGAHQMKTGTIKPRTLRHLLRNKLRWHRALPMRLRMQMQLRGLREWAALRFPKQPETTKKNPVVKAISKAVSAATHCQAVQKVIGYFGRKFPL